MSPWSAVIENQVSGKTKCCNVGDLKPKHPSKDWELKLSSIGRAEKFINHLDNLPDVDIIPDHDMTPTVPSVPRDNVGTRYNIRKSIKAPTGLELWPTPTKNARDTQNKKKRKRSLVVFPLFYCGSLNVDIFTEFLAFDEELNEVAQALDEAVAHLLPHPQSSPTTTGPCTGLPLTLSL